MPQDLSSYPQFAGGQAAAWTELNTLAQEASPLIGPAYQHGPRCLDGQRPPHRRKSGEPAERGAGVCRLHGRDVGESAHL